MRAGDGVRQVFEPFDVDAEEGPEQEDADILDAFGAPGAQHERDDDQVGGTDAGIEKRDGNFLVLQRCHREPRQRHECR